MKRYCMVNVIKQELMDQYINDHLNPWQELLDCLKEAGTNEELIYMYNDLAIIFIECEDISIYMEKFAKSEVGMRWLKKMVPYLVETKFTDSAGETKESVTGLRKVFDLNQQLAGTFDSF